jgi:hypothetical protein
VYCVIFVCVLDFLFFSLNVLCVRGWQRMLVFSWVKVGSGGYGCEMGWLWCLEMVMWVLEVVMWCLEVLGWSCSV